MNFNLSDPNEIRTRVTAVKGRCLNRLTMEPYLSHCFVFLFLLRDRDL